MSKKKCKSCNSEVEPSAKFCPECGSRQENLTHDEPISKSDKPQKVKDGRSKEAIITVGAIAVISLGYFVIVEPEPIPEQNVPQQMAGHGEGGAEMTLPNLPEDYDGLVAIGDQYMDQSNFPLAAECYKRALEIDSSSVNVRSDFGSCLYGMGLGNRALEEFQKVLAIDPSHSIAVFNIGVVFYGQNAIDSAKYYMNEYLRLDPEGKAAGRAKEIVNEMGS